VNFSGIPIYVALEAVDMRMGYDRLSGMVRERMEMNPRGRALFVFVGKRGHLMKILTWDGTGDIIISKRLDAGGFEMPRPTMHGQQHVIVSDALFAAIFAGGGAVRRKRKQTLH
jgi:transposase